MRVKTFYRALRFISAIVLFFFVWTFGPIWQAVAYAAESRKMSGMKREGTTRTADTHPVTSGEKFEKNLESIRELINAAQKKSNKGQEPFSELDAIKVKKAQIDTIDAELKSEFSVTEKRLKDAKLPQVILDRHAAFVKNYEKNFTQLKSELDDIDKAKTASDRKAKLETARLHLEKVKPPKKHVPLDPNNLPNRMVKAKAPRAPRLKKEDFEKDFPLQRHKGMKTADSRLTTDITSWTMHRASVSKPILVASNGPLSGLLSSDSKIETPALPFSDVANGVTLNSELGTMYLAQAQSPDLPIADDLSETLDVQFTDAIRAKALELGGNPVKIYEWVRNNIEYAPTYGSIQGADQCLQSQICNDMDTASLLIALLRISGIYAHYVYGTVDIPTDKAMNWVGGVTDPKMAGTIFATTGIPATGHISGGTIDYQRIEHVWVKAFIDMIPSRGAVHKQGDTWVPLDASFKQYNYTQGIDISTSVPFDAQTFANMILSTATTNTTDGSVTNVNSAYVQQTMQNYQTQVQNYIQQNYPNATVGDVIGKKEIIQQNYPILLGTLPYKVVQVGFEFATVPDNLRETISFSIPDPTGATAGLTYTTGMPQIAGKKITLSFSPATANDESVIESLLPQPNPDGTPIDPSQFPSSFPAYLINLVPELRIDGHVVATGSTGAMGTAQSFTVSLNELGIGMSNIDNIVKSGEYFAIGVDTGRVGVGSLNAFKTKLDSIKTKLETGAYDGLTKDDVVGNILCNTIAAYFAELDAADEVAARATNIIRYRVPSIGMFSLSLNTNESFGIPISATPKGMMLDVDRLVLAAFSKDGNIDSVKRYMLSSGVNSSTLEHVVPELIFSTATNQVQGISAIKTLQYANDQGIPIYVINQSNINTLLPQLQLNGDVKTDIQNAVNAGKIVTVQKEYVTYNGWTGCGYIIIDPTTGAGAYKISDGLNGGGFAYKFWTFMLQLAWFVLLASLALIAAILILLLPEIIAVVSAVGATIGAIGAAVSSATVTTGAAAYVYIGAQSFDILMDAAFLCIFSGMESPPDQITAACSISFVIAMIIKNAFMK